MRKYKCATFSANWRLTSETALVARKHMFLSINPIRASGAAPRTRFMPAT